MKIAWNARGYVQRISKGKNQGSQSYKVIGVKYAEHCQAIDVKQALVRRQPNHSLQFSLELDFN